MSQRSKLTAEALRAAPPVTVAGATIAGVPLNDLILWATLLYLVLQIGFLLYRWWQMHTQMSNPAKQTQRQAQNQSFTIIARAVRDQAASSCCSA